MNRRQAIGWGAAAAIAIPAGWAWWKKSDFEDVKIFSKSQEEALSAAVDALLPEDTTPGGKTLGVDKFVSKMLQDCYSSEDRAAFATELKVLAGKSFSTQSPQDRIALLKAYPEDSTFISLLRGLSIRGYNTSEYVMTNIQHFQFIPGHYSGCVNLDLHA
jgi:hypothetical protein